jgi:hypothetical protein
LSFDQPPGKPPHTVLGLALGTGSSGEPVAYELAVPWRDAER